MEASSSNNIQHAQKCELPLDTHILACWILGVVLATCG